MLVITKRRSSFTLAVSLFACLSCSAVSAQTFNIQKRNTNFSIDGNGGARIGQQAYLWNTSNSNVNQHWVETEVENGFYSYRKQNTSLCLDGGNGGARRQAVVLFTCSASNRNQQWEKVNQAGGSIRLKKRGVSFSIDGNNGASRRQQIYLWNSGGSNVNQHWIFRNVGGTTSGSTPPPPPAEDDNNGGNNTPPTPPTADDENTSGVFPGVRWTTDTSNTPRQDRDGSGRTPSTSGATNSRANFQFEISTTSTSGLQRQEFQFERRSGLHRFRGEFRMSSAQPDFNRVSIAQTHDDQTGSEGVFSIYQVRRSGSNYVFGVQGDTREASNGYSTFDTVRISLDRWYRLEIFTESINRDDTREVAILRDANSGNEIWRETVEGGGEDEQYRKAGAYRLTNGSGRVIVDWRNMQHWTGRR